MFRLFARKTSPKKNIRRVSLHVEELESRLVPAVTIDSFTMPYSGYEGQTISMSAGATDSAH